MRPNRLHSIWEAGQPALNAWLSIGSSFTAEIMAAQGYDSVTVDLQHGALDYSHALVMLQAIGASGVVPLARVPWLEPGIIMKVLDAGAYGVICPMINTAEEAARFVRFVRYPPAGERSFGPTRAAIAAGTGYAVEANATILALAMIETAEAMDNLDEIAATPGLDGIYVGPADLSASLSKGTLLPAVDREEPEIVAALQSILHSCKKHGLRVGIHCGSPDYAVRAVAWGFDLATVSSDVRIFSGAAAASVARFRELLGQPMAATAKPAY